MTDNTLTIGEVRADRESGLESVAELERPEGLFVVCRNPRSGKYICWEYEGGGRTLCRKMFDTPTLGDVMAWLYDQGHLDGKVTAVGKIESLCLRIQEGGDEDAI